MNEEKIKDLFEEGTEEKEVKEEGNNSIVVSNVNELRSANASKVKVFTSLDISDTKAIFNLENKEADFRINDCVDQSIRMVDVYIKTFEKKLSEPEVDEETGEVVRDTEYKKVCVIIDDQGKSYVTASKTFTLEMMNYLALFGIDKIHEGVEIKFIKKSIKNSSNKALGFELL
ncbi:MAG: hypothetical protein IIZ67_01950 [Bacilli bacterium]|nr:hypothetical protein [Bacilli bacterium]